MHGQYLRELDGKDGIKSWKWLKDSDLKGCTEAMICSAQEQAIRTNNTKFYIDKTSDSPMCRMCGDRTETVSHIISECSELAQKEYKDVTTTLENTYIGNFVRNIILMQKQDGMNTHQKA